MRPGKAQDRCSQLKITIFSKFSSTPNPPTFPFLLQAVADCRFLLCQPSSSQRHNVKACASSACPIPVLLHSPRSLHSSSSKSLSENQVELQAGAQFLTCIAPAENIVLRFTSVGSWWMRLFTEYFVSICSGKPPKTTPMPLLLFYDEIPFIKCSTA